MKVTGIEIDGELYKVAKAEKGNTYCEECGLNEKYTRKNTIYKFFNERIRGFRRLINNYYNIFSTKSTFDFIKIMVCFYF